jgi:hypothetical protein
MKTIAESHLDHGLTKAQVEFILGIDAPAGQVTVQTVELPEDLGTVPCGLHGPVMGDEPVLEADVTYEVRGQRKGASRLVERPIRSTRIVTVISGPHEGEPCVLYTAFGGPQAPREPFEDDSEESQIFWSQHALSSEEDGS